MFALFMKNLVGDQRQEAALGDPQGDYSSHHMPRAPRDRMHAVKRVGMFSANVGGENAFVGRQSNMKLLFQPLKCHPPRVR